VAKAFYGVILDTLGKQEMRRLDEVKSALRLALA